MKGERGVMEHMYRKGDLTGVMPSNIGVTKIFYSGGKKLFNGKIKQRGWTY